MSETSSGTAQPLPVPTHPPFPFVRLLWAIGFAFLGWVALWIVFVLAIVQFVMLAANGHVHEEIKRFSLSLIQYLWEVLAFVAFVRDEQPFPIGPFPKTATS